MFRGKRKYYLETDQRRDRYHEHTFNHGSVERLQKRRDGLRSWHRARWWCRRTYHSYKRIRQHRKWGKWNWLSGETSHTNTQSSFVQRTQGNLWTFRYTKKKFVLCFWKKRRNRILDCLWLLRHYRLRLLYYGHFMKSFLTKLLWFCNDIIFFITGFIAGGVICMHYIYLY